MRVVGTRLGFKKCNGRAHRDLVDRELGRVEAQVHRALGGLRDVPGDLGDLHQFAVLLLHAGKKEPVDVHALLGLV